MRRLNELAGRFINPDKWGTSDKYPDGFHLSYVSTEAMQLRGTDQF